MLYAQSPVPIMIHLLALAKLTVLMIEDKSMHKYLYRYKDSSSETEIHFCITLKSHKH